MADDNLGTGFTAYLENSAGGGVFTAIGDVLGGSWSGVSRGEEEVTDLSNVTRQFIAGLADLGTLTLRLAWDMGDTVQDALQAEVEAGPTADGKDMALYHSGMAYRLDFTGFLTSFVPGEIAPGGHMTVTITYRINSVTGPTSGAPATS